MRYFSIFSILAMGLLFANAGYHAISATILQQEIKIAANQPPNRSSGPSRDFQTLDAYLAHLKKLGAQDYPFYELVGPDRYKLNIGRGGNRVPAKYFSRDELMRKFGFDR